jgi:DNA-binding XRE family transcriptional regulator
VFNSKTQIRNFINGDSFVTEERAIKSEESTKLTSILLDEAGATSNLAKIIVDANLSQTTIPNISVGTDNFPENISRLLINARKSFRLTQKECADLVGVSEGTIQNFENGNLRAHRESKIKIIKFLDLLKLAQFHNSQAYIMRTLLHMKMGVFGNRTAIEFAKLLPQEKRIFEVFSQYKKIYE